MSREHACVEGVKEGIQARLVSDRLHVSTGFRLPYAMHVESYPSDSGGLITTAPKTRPFGYQTDLLIADLLEGGGWVPRVVVEFKFGRISTHDALTYSAKAATHKNVHPYLRYGIVVGGYDAQVPVRLVRHGHHFDFMLTIASEVLGDADQEQVVSLLQDEVQASREIGGLLSAKSSIRLVHRKLHVG